MIRLTEIYHRSGDTMFENWSLREIGVNPTHVIKMNEDEQLKEYLFKGFLPKDLSKDQSFTRIMLINGPSVVVVGSLGAVSEKLQGRTGLLKG